MSKINVRDALLETGMQVFHHQGFNATGVQEIADGAKVPKGSFYNYFSSKDAFAVEVIDLYARTSSTLGILLDVTLGDATARLHLYFDALIAGRKQRSFRAGCLLGNLSTELADQSELVREKLAVSFADWSRVLEDCIRQAQHAAAIDDRIPAATLAALLLNGWEGAVLRSKVDRNDDALQQFRVLTRELLGPPKA